MDSEDSRDAGDAGETVEAGAESAPPKESGSGSRRGARRSPAASADSSAGAPPEKSGEKPARSRTRRRGGRGRSRSSEAAETRETDSPSVEPTEERTESRPETKGRGEGASRKRGGAASRRRSPRKRDDEEEGKPSPETDPVVEAEEDSTPARAEKGRRKRGSRGGRRRKRKVPDEAAVGIEIIPGEDDEFSELADLPEDAELVPENRDEAPEEDSKRRRKVTRARRTKKSKAKEPRKARSSKTEGTRESSSRTRKTAAGRRSTVRAKSVSSPVVVAPEAEHRRILVNAGDSEDTRVAVVEDGWIVDLQMTVEKHTSFVSDIYRGRVVNLESAIGAAFVDFGQGRNGFLHASDVLACYGERDWKLDKLLSTAIDLDDREHAAEKSAEKEDGKGGKKMGGRRARPRTKRPRLPIEQLLKKGQMVAVQITKDAIGDKGPTLTTYISIPSRYLVLMPSLERTGVSRKIEDEKERRRLKRILSALDIPEGMGVIVRTAGVGKTNAEIKRDLDYLLLAWEDFSKRLVSGRNPAPLYQESDVAIRTVRDLFTANTEAVITDDEEVHQRLIDFTRKLMPEHEDRFQLHVGTRPLFNTYGVEQDFEKIFSRRVELPSGGSIVIDQTEALVAIDVNSGRTREDGAEFEDIALKTNLEAAPEIARQMRLRDLGGIIVLDFIDMMRLTSRRTVERVLRDALAPDRARNKIGRISQFGLLELTRQRLGPGLSRLVYETCRHCRGSGRLRNASSRAQAILRRLGASLTLKGFTTVEVRAHPETIEYLEKQLSRQLDALEDSSGRKLVLISVPDQLEDSVLHYLRADGREVRPGGRRKR